MKCPFCGSEDTRVIDSRAYADGNSIKRRRACENCGKRFTTHEKVVDLALYVIKKAAKSSLIQEKKCITVLRGRWKKEM